MSELRRVVVTRLDECGRPMGEGAEVEGITHVTLDSEVTIDAEDLILFHQAEVARARVAVILANALKQEASGA